MEEIKVIQLGNGEVEIHGAAPVPHYAQPPVLQAGQFAKNARIGLVRFPSGKTATFAGDLLKMALENGAKLVREIQPGIPQ